MDSHGFCCAEIFVSEQSPARRISLVCRAVYRCGSHFLDHFAALDDISSAAAFSLDSGGRADRAKFDRIVTPRGLQNLELSLIILNTIF